MADDLVIHIHADESCLGNQFVDRDNPGGGAGLVEYWKEGGWERRDFWISDPATTNNRMALESATEGLRQLKRSCQVVFVSDSQYLGKGMSELLHGWKARGWKRKAGPIENLELWQILDREAARHEVSWRWVKGHAGHPKNEYAKHLATGAAKRLDASGGLVESGFDEWLADERKRGRYVSWKEPGP
jgi:ribonuclease HI